MDAMRNKGRTKAQVAFLYGLCIFLWSVGGLAMRTLRKIEVVARAARGTGDLRQGVLLLFLDGEELELTAFGADVNVDGKRAGKKVWERTEKPAALAELYLVTK